MIDFEKYILDNGLQLIIHPDKSTPLAAVNIMYNVGSRDEKPDKTGFAHLFEHLMFGGSVNIPKYDEPLEKVGGENNAFTNNDITNYYCTLPYQNIETAFWLESDRMLNLAFTPKSLDVQRNVVIEEFKQNYLNQPYGDEWLLLRPLAYKKHPYQWSTIGKEISHIREATMEDVKSFYRKFYNPNNAVFVVAGNVDMKEVLKYSEKWFGPLENQSGKYIRNIPEEPGQKNARELTVEREVPLDAIYIAFHMCNRLKDEYYTTDLISDILSNGNSSRLYQKFVKERQLFSEINAFITGDMDEGLFVFSGKIMPGVKISDAEDAIHEEIEFLKNYPVKEEELTKVKNKVEAAVTYTEISLLNKAINLAYYDTLGNIELVNQQKDKYSQVSSRDVQNTASKLFAENNRSTLYYLSKK